MQKLSLVVLLFLIVALGALGYSGRSLLGVDRAFQSFPTPQVFCFIHNWTCNCSRSLVVDFHFRKNIIEKDAQIRLRLHGHAWMLRICWHLGFRSWDHA